MDIQHLVDRLEDLIDEGRHLPMSKFTLIDEERILSIIDQMRISVPEQIEAASRVINQRDNLISQANDEAERIIDQARQKGVDMLEQDTIVVAARNHAKQVKEQAAIEAERVRAEADNYVVEVLHELENHLLRTLTIVRNGIAKVAQDRDAKHQMQAAAYQQQQRQQQAAQPAPVQQQPSMPVPKREEVPVEVDNSQS